jgi:hypothetical protein
VDSPNEPGKGRTGKSATLMNTARRRSPDPAAVTCVVEGQPWSPAPSSTPRAIAETESNPPCHKSLSRPSVATRAPQNR